MNVMWRMIKEKPDVDISLPLSKSSKQAARFNIPIWWRISIKSTNAFPINSLRRDLGFNPGIFGPEISDWGSAPPSLLIPASDRNEISNLPGSEGFFIVCFYLKKTVVLHDIQPSLNIHTHDCTFFTSMTSSHVPFNWQIALDWCHTT